MCPTKLSVPANRLTGLRCFRVILTILSIFGLSLCSFAQSRNPDAIATDELSSEESDEEITKLSPFEVTSGQERGYRKLSTVTTSRAGVEIINDPVAIEVISSELLKDFSLTDKAEAFKFSNSVTTVPNEVFAGPLIVLRGFDAPLFYNGTPLSNVFGLTPYLLTDNIDRVEVAKGAAGLLYGNTTAGGVINYVSKKPQFINAASVDLTVGTYEYQKALVDYQTVLRPGLAARLIASTYGTTGRIDDQHKDMTMVAPSITYRSSNDKFEVNLAATYTNQHTPYPTSFPSLGVNPQYYEDYLNPSQSILDYMKLTYGLADDVAARAKVVERWGEQATRNSYLANWVADTLGRTGVEQYRYTNPNFDWWRFSPRGDKVNLNGIGSHVDGTTLMTEFGMRLTPLPNLTVNYDWKRMNTSQGLWLGRVGNYNGGVRPDGRVYSLDAALSTSTSPNGGLPAMSDTQQLDVLYTFNAFGIEHQIQGGAEWRRQTSGVDRVPLDFSKAASGIAWDGSVLTGRDALAFYDPFGGAPMPDIKTIQSGGLTQGATKTLAKYRDYYVSYRGQAMDGKLNLLAGMRQVNLLWPEPEGTDYTWTVGALYTVTPGFRVFASSSKVIVFTNQMNIDNSGVTAADNPHKLDNESGEGFEFGIKTDWRDNTLSGSISYYRDRRANIVSQDQVKTAADPRNSDNDPNNIVTWWSNGGLYQVQGIDGDLTWTPSANFQAIVNWNYMWEANILSDPSQDPANANTNAYKRLFDFRRVRSPEWKTNLVMKYNFTSGPLKGLSLGAGIAYTDTHHMTDSALYNMPVPAETIYDIFFAYQTKVLSTPTTFRLNLINLTDEVNDIYRGNGREIRLSVELEY